MRVPSLKIIKIPHIDTIVIKQHDRKFFITTKDSIVIDTTGLYMIIEFLILNNMIDSTILERILDEYRSRQN